MHGDQRVALPGEMDAVREPALESAIDEECASGFGASFLFGQGQPSGARKAQSGGLARARTGFGAGNA